MVQESIRRHRGIAIYSGDQSVNSIEASRFEMFRRGLYLDLFHYTRKFSRRLWRYWKAPLEDARIIVALASRPYDFVLLCGGDEHMRRPHLLRLILTIAKRRSIPVHVRWGTCSWILQHKRVVLGEESFRKSVALLSAPHISHLSLTAHSARDLTAETGIVPSTIILNSKKLPKEFLTRLAPDDDPPLVINVATVQPRKGPDLFVEVAARVCVQHPTVRFIWIGGHAPIDLQARLEEMGLKNRVEFIGKVYPPWQWMHRASLMLLTSRSEAFGLAVAEAMACYRTVCVFADTGAADAVGDTGIVVAQFDINEMARRIIEFLSQDTAERINDKARQRYDELFAPEPFADRMISVLCP